MESPRATSPADMPPWLADGDPVHLDDEFVAATLPTRTHPPISLPQPDWSAVTAALAPARIALDLDRTDPTIRDTVIASQNKHPSEYDRAERAVLLAMARYCSDLYRLRDQLVHAIAAQHGVLEATHTIIESLRIDGTRYSDGIHNYVRFSLLMQPDAGSAGPYDPLDICFQALRQRACLASEDEYARIVALVRASASDLTPMRRVNLALALPDAPDLSNALIAELADSDEESLHWLQATATDTELIKRVQSRKHDRYHAFELTPAYLNTLVVNRGSAALSTLLAHVATDTAGDAAARIGLPETIRALTAAANVGKSNQVRLRTAIDRWPAAAIAGLAQVLGGAGRDADTSRTRLADLVLAQPELADAVRPWLSGSAARALDSVIGQVRGDHDEATSDELPQVLVSPPWLRPKPKTVLVEDVKPLPMPPVAHWPEGQRELWSEQWNRHRPSVSTVVQVANSMCREYYAWNATPVPPALKQNVFDAIQAGDLTASVAAFRAWVRAYRATRRYQPATVDGYLLCGAGAPILDRVSPGFGLQLWNALAGTGDDDTEVSYVLAQHDVAALPGLVSVIRHQPNEHLSKAITFGAVELAPMVARAYRTSKTLRDVAEVWLRTHPEHAAGGLIAAAIGKPGEARDNAATALRAMTAFGMRALILSTAADYERDDVTAAVSAMLEESPTDLYPTKRPKLPAYWSPASWRRPKLHSGKSLPLEAIDNLGTMLAFPTTDGVYAGIGHVVDACTADSLADFGWDLFSAWLAAGAPSKDNWTMTSLGLFGNDDTARRFTVLVRTWPGESQHKRAVTGLDVLAGIGSDFALMQLNGIANKVKFKALQDRAKDKITEIAHNRGLSTAELADRLAPDLGLEPDGTMLLDFGPRQFRVGFDEALKPFVRDSGGSRLKELPKARRDDDAELAKAATARWKVLKKDAGTVAGQQMLRLELAMCARRRWKLPEFEQFLVGHPLVRHLVRRLVWATYTAGGILETCFRVTADQRYTDAGDNPITLSDNAIVGLPHVLELPDGDAAAFAQLFSDHELSQPFTQLGRDTYRLNDAEKASTELTRWKDLVVPTGKVLGLTNRGWERGVPMDAGVVNEMKKTLPRGWQALAELSDGIVTGALDVAPEQSITRVIVGPPSGRWPEVNQQSLSELDDITVSELIRDLEGLRG